HQWTVIWRSGRDSNPRYGFAVYSLSRRAPSTTRPPLRRTGLVHHQKMRLEGRHVGKPATEGNGRAALAAYRAQPLCRGMPTFGSAPSLADIEVIARRALAGLPEPFADSLCDIVLLVEEF